ncbi:periplasmic copper chaperone A [Frankia sp. AiPs1]|uniref:hypothetical protein n=1 Tax=Frankia sp. AiPa1 TaxID=573492 RepID=UPI00202B92D3|nr:hypothetical protein [Frankia sp. AiPa1]MCL9761834.1 hypothetical protein [Frankia sp. AiPa1]
MSRRPGARISSVIAAGGAPAHHAAVGVGTDAARPGEFRRRMASRRVGVALLASVIGAAGLTSCAAGTDALTNYARTTTNSTAGAIGAISLRNVYLAGPVKQGGSAPIVSAFFNSSDSPDTLVSVTSPSAGSGRVSSPAEIPAGGGHVFIADGSAPSLQGVPRDLLIGAQLPITFTFAKAGSITLQVPVEPAAPGASVSPSATEAALSPTSASPLSTSSASPSTSAQPGASLSAGPTTPASPAAGASVPSPSAG